MLVGAALLALPLAAAPLEPLPPAVADSAGGGSGSTTEADDETGTAELLVAPQAPVLEAAATQAQFRVLLRNGTEQVLPEGSVELSIGRRLQGGAALAAAAIPPTALDPSSVAIATQQVGATGAGNEQELTITVPLVDMPLLSIRDRGVYQLTASYLPADGGATGQLLAASPLVWAGIGPSDESIDLTLIVPIMLPAEIDTMPTPARLGELAPRWNALLDVAVRAQSVLAIDPRVTAAIRAYGGEAPQNARELLARLERTALTSFALQFGDADPAAQAALGASELMGPNGFEFVTRLGSWGDADGDAGAGQTPAPAPGTGAGTGTAPGAAQSTGEPTPDELAAWEPGVAAAWPAGGQADARTLSLLHAAGLNLTVLRSDNVELTGGPRASLSGGGSTLVTDAALDAGVRLALAAPSSTERDLGAAQAAARLLTAAQNGVRGLVLGVDRGGIAEADSPETLLATLADSPWVSTVGLAAQAPGIAQLREGTPAGSRVELLAEAVENEAFVLEARSLLVNPVYLDGYQRMRLLSLFATAHAAPEADFAATAEAFAKRDEALHNGVQVIGTKRTQLVGAQTRIPVQVRNSLPFDTIVNMRVAPTSAALAVSERSFDGLELPEDSTGRVLVPVNSRVSSGESGLFISVTSTDKAFTASSSVLPVSISTTVETIALAVLGAAAVLLLAFGIRRSLRRRVQGGGIARL